MPDRPKKRAIFVVGMHRSGTSAMAGALALAGCALPERLMPANFANPIGYFEPQDAADLDDAVLAAAESSWSDPFGPRGHRRRPAHQPGHVSEARELLRRDYSGKDLIVFKEPRASLLIDLWRTAAMEEGYEPQFVIMVRHPAETARSLTERDGLTRNRGLLLWATYMLAAETSTRGDKRLFVAFDALLENTEAVLDRIEQAFGFSLPRRGWKTATEIEAFLRPDLVHHRRLNGLGAPALAPIEDLYGFLERAARGEKENADTPGEVAAWLDGLEETMAPILAQAETARPDRSSAPEVEELQSDLTARSEALAEARRAASAQAARTTAAVAALEQQRAGLAAERDAALDKAAGLERDLGWKLEAAAREAARSRERTVELETERAALEVRAEASRAEWGDQIAEIERQRANALARQGARELALEAAVADLRREARRSRRNLAARLARAQQRAARADQQRTRLEQELEAGRAHDREQIDALDARLSEALARSTWELQSLVLKRSAKIVARRLGFARKRPERS